MEWIAICYCVSVLYFVSITNGYIPIKIIVPGMILRLNMTVEDIRNDSEKPKEISTGPKIQYQEKFTKLIEVQQLNNSTTRLPEETSLSPYQIPLVNISFAPRRLSENTTWNQTLKEVTEATEEGMLGAQSSSEEVQVISVARKIDTAQMSNIGLYSLLRGHKIDYLHASKWGHRHPSCFGHRQSPIDINPQFTSRAVDRIWHHLEDMPSEMLIINNGNTIQITGKWQQTPYLQGPGILPYKGRYVLSDVIFHWARVGSGSEHCINGRRFAMEIQLVFYKEQGNKDIQQAIENDDHIAIISILYQVVQKDHPLLFGLIQGVKEVKYARTMANIQPFPLSFLIPRNTSYFEYAGSLTIPPCTETVTWLVMEKPANISMKQLEAFKEVLTFDNSTVIINSRMLSRRLLGPVHFNDV